MNIRYLTLAIALGLGSINTPLLIQPAAAAISMEQEALASTVEARFNNINQLSSELYNRIIGADPMFKHIGYETVNYERNADGATATTTLTIVLNKALLDDAEVPEHITLNFDNQITYNDSLLSQDVIADINTTLVVDEAFQSMADLDSDDLKKLQNALQYIEMHSQLLPEGVYTNRVTIKPFNVAEDSEHIDFQGLVLDSKGNEADISKAAGTVHLDMKKLTVVSKEDDDFSESESDPTFSTFTLAPFTLDYALTGDGDLTLDSSPMTITTQGSQDDLTINVERISGEGSGIEFDSDIATFLGKQHYRADNILIHDKIENKELRINHFAMDNNVSKVTIPNHSDALYGIESGVTIDLDAGSFSNLSGLHGLSVKRIYAQFDAHRLSANLYNVINELAYLDAGQDDAAVRAKLQSLLSDLAYNQSHFQIDFALDSEQGEATLSIDVDVKKDAVTDVASWEQAFEQPGPGAAINLLQKSVNFDIKASVPQSIIDAVGLTDMMAMTVGYVVKEGDTYSAHLQNSADGIKLNGNVIPLPQ